MIRVKENKSVRIRKPADALPSEAEARRCEDCGALIRYGGGNEMTRLKVTDSHLTTNVFFCHSCTFEADDKRILHMATVAIEKRRSEIRRMMNRLDNMEEEE